MKANLHSTPTAPPSSTGESTGKQIWRGSLWLWFQTAADIGLAFVFTWVILQRLGPGGFGTVVLVQTTLNLAGLLTLNPEQALIRYLPDLLGQHRQGEARQMVAAVFMVKTALAGLAAVLLWFLAPWLSYIFAYPDLVSALRVGCLSLFAVSIANTGIAACLGLIRLPVRAWLTVVRRLVEIGVVVAAGLQGVDPVKVVFGLAMGDVAAAIGFSAAVHYYLRKISDEDGSKPSLRMMGKRIFRYCLPLLGVNATDLAGSNLTKLFVGALASPAVFGYYSVARMASERLILFMAQAPMLAVPVIAQKKHSSEEIRQAHPLIGRVLELQWVLAGAGVLVTWATAPLVLQIIGGQEFQHSINAMRIMSFAVMVNSANSSLHVFFLAHERTMGNLYQAGFQFLCGLVFVGLLVPLYGTAGAAFSDVGRELAAMVIGTSLVRKWFGFHFTDNLRRLLLTSGLILLLILPISIWPSIGTNWLVLVWLPVALLLYGFIVLPTMLRLSRLSTPVQYDKIKANQ